MNLRNQPTRPQVQVPPQFTPVYASQVFTYSVFMISAGVKYLTGSSSSNNNNNDDNDNNNNNSNNNSNSNSNSNNNNNNNNVCMHLCVACAFDLGARGPCRWAAWIVLGVIIQTLRIFDNSVAINWGPRFHLRLILCLGLAFFQVELTEP